MGSFLNRLLLFRFFSQLRRDHRVLFIFFLCVAGVQLTMTLIKWNAVPFLLYGMYSEKAPVSVVVTRRQVLLDTVPLPSIRMPKRQLFLLQGTMDHYLSVKNNGGVDPVQTRVESKGFDFFTEADFYPWIRKKIFNNKEDLQSFELWYKQKCTSILGHRIDSIRVIEYQYRLDPDYSSLKAVSGEQVIVF